MRALIHRRLRRPASAPFAIPSLLSTVSDISSLAEEAHLAGGEALGVGEHLVGDDLGHLVDDARRSCVEEQRHRRR